jgi:23S rRNA (adenine2503-C2)-methyltransferase
MPDGVIATTKPISKVNLLGMTRVQLEHFFAEMGEKKFRAQQVMKWIHHQGVCDFQVMTNLGKTLRDRLETLAEITPPGISSQQDSTDGTRKWAISVTGGALVEAVLIPEGDRATLCVSSQVGCSLDCKFCSTGKQGFQRDLTAAEIIGQVWLAINSYDGWQPGKGRVVTNVVMMGMGEPLLNFDNVVSSMDLMCDDLAYGLSKRKVTLSTSGVVPALDKLAELSDVSLAISLHAPNDEIRDKIVPLNRRYPIDKLLSSARAYIDAQTDKKRVVTIEYFNDFPNSGFERPSGNAVSRFWKVLMEAGFIVTVRTTRGDDIDAACGQLVGDVNDRTKRSARYRAQYEELETLEG